MSKRKPLPVLIPCFYHLMSQLHLPWITKLKPDPGNTSNCLFCFLFVLPPWNWSDLKQEFWWPPQGCWHSFICLHLYCVGVIKPPTGHLLGYFNSRLSLAALGLTKLLISSLSCPLLKVTLVIFIIVDRIFKALGFVALIKLPTACETSDAPCLSPLYLDPQCLSTWYPLRHCNWLMFPQFSL